MTAQPASATTKIHQIASCAFPPGWCKSYHTHKSEGANQQPEKLSLAPFPPLFYIMLFERPFAVCCVSPGKVERGAQINTRQATRVEETESIDKFKNYQK